MTKQVIVMRNDLNMRKGKMIAQGSHGTVANVRRLDKAVYDETISPEQLKEYNEWLDTSYRKITVQVNSEEELMDIYHKAVELGLNVDLIEDSGLTEFHGVKTKTCLSIGPHYNEKIDVITSHLKLL